MALDSLIPDRELDNEAGPLVRAQPRSRRPARRTFEITPEDEDQLSQIAKSFAAKAPVQTTKPTEEKPLGLMGTIREGAKSTLRTLGATVDTAQGDAEGVVKAAQDQAAAPKDPDLEKFYAHIDEQKKALGENPSLFEGIKAVGSAAINNPRGFGLMIAEQLPNSAAALGAGAAGALAGSIAGPGGAVVGGLAGLAGANIGLETGSKALEAAQDNSFTPEEQSRVKKEGFIKGGVITGIDATTLGVTKFITGTTRRAVERATTKTLADNGVDITNAAARKAALETPEIADAVKSAQKLAKEGANKLGQRLARTGGAAALETIGEGAGEYLGELAATGKANAVDAVVEGFAGLGTSIGEIAATSALNRKGLQRLFDNPETAEKAAKDQAKETGVPHEVIPSPTDADKFVAVPKARSVGGIELERDKQGNLKPTAPVSTQADFNLANKQGFELTAEDKLREQELQRQREADYAKNPIIVPGQKSTGPTLGGKPVDQLPGNVLLYTVNRGGARAQKIATDEIERRKNEGEPVNVAPETPVEAVKRIIETGADKAKEDAKKAKTILTPAPAPKNAAKPLETAKPSNPEVVLPNNTSLPAQWDVVDADSVKATLKDGKNQPRDRSRAASDIQIQGIANNPDYRRLSDSPVMDVGASTISHDGAIVGGNGRFEGISRAYDQGTAGDYLASLKADATNKGIDPAKIGAMKKPVLVRRITQPFDVRKLAIASNSGTGLQYSGMELAKIDAERMKDLHNLEITDSGDIALTGSNMQNVRTALSGYSAAELGSLTGKDGALSQEGVRRIRNAMLYSAYGSNPTLERLVESTDNDLRNISGALVKAAGSAAKARADIKAGKLPAELDISEDLVGAVETLSKIKSQGMTVEEYLAQTGLFGEELTDDTKEILRTLEANIRSQRKIADFIRTYYDAVSHLDTATGDMFGAKIPNKQELLKNAKDKVTEKQPDTQDLFTKPNRPNTPEKPREESPKQPTDNASPKDSGKKDQVAKPEPTPNEKSGEKQIREAVESAPNFILRKWNPVTITYKGSARHFLAGINRIVSNGKDRSTIHLLKITYGRMLAGLPKEYITTNFKLNKNNVLTEEGQATATTEDDLKTWRAAGLPIDGEDTQPTGQLRPLIESLIKRRSAAKQSGKERSINTAINRAKEVMDGTRTDTALESKWFRVQAAAMRKADPDTADILSQISEATKPKKPIEQTPKEVKQNANTADEISIKDIKIGDQFNSVNYRNISATSGTIEKVGSVNIVFGKTYMGNPTTGIKLPKAALIGGSIKRDGKILKVISSTETPAFSRNQSSTTNPDISAVQGIVTNITSKWKNAPQVVVLGSMADAPAEVKAENERQLSQGATGEPEGFIHGNKVYIVASQMNHPGDVLRVMLHESLGHFGLRGVFGEGLNTILRQVARSRRKDIDAKAKQYGLDPNKESDRLIAAEELLAELAQKNPKSNFVQRAIAAIRSWLRQNIPGFENLKLTDAEMIENFLVPAREFVKNGRGKSNSVEIDGIKTPVFSRSPATAPLRDRIDKITDSLIYNFQDRFKPLKDIQKRAGAVAENEDAALAEERYSGMVRARTDTFEEQLRDPLLKAIHDSGVPYEEVEQYLHALHAPSRNAAMKEINPTESELKTKTDALEKQRDTLAKDADVLQYIKTRRELRQAEADIDDGIADESLARTIKGDIAQLKRLPNVKDYTEALDKLKALRLVKPFDGDNTALSGMSDAESAQILSKIDANGKKKALEKISALVDTITSKTRQIYVDSGLEKADAIEAWNKKYEHYVPLHRDEVNGNTMPRVGQGFNIKGKESKRATGSTKEVTNILAHVVAQHEAAIIRSEKATVDRTLFRFASTHPDPSLWTLDNAPMLRTVDPVSGFVVERVDPTYKNRPEVLTLKIDGEEHTITFNDQNEEAMRLATSMKNLSAEQLGQVTTLVGKFTRFLAMANTTANPVFTARNFLRDLQTTFINLSDTELANKKREVFGDVGSAIKGMWDLSRGKHNSQWAKYAQEFKNAGGQTGWMDHYRDIGERAEKLKKELAAMQPGKLRAAKRTFDSWWQIVQDANNAVENGARLSAFVNARKSGMSEAKAAQLAKNLTVNFNAHGAKGVELNMWYMFMNASIQGTARLVKALSNKQVRHIVAGVILSGFLMDIVARSMAADDDEDGENDYDQLPEHVKAMNFVFMVNNRPVTIPMPYGYNFFASTGRKISEMMFRENYSPVKSAFDLAGIFVDAFSPTGQAGSGLQYVSPTVTDPFIQWAENKNFAGNPLRKPQNPFGVPNPEYQMGFKSTSAPAKWLAEALNDATGGNEVRPGFVNVNPAFFDFAVSSIAGGAGRTYLQVASAPTKIAKDEEVQAKEVPFLNIFVGAKPEHQTEKKYFEAVKSVELAQKELKEYREKGDTEMVRQIREEHGKEIRLAEAAKATKALLTRLRKSDHDLDKTDPPNKSELRKAIEEKKKEAMSRFNKRYREAIMAD